MIAAIGVREMARHAMSYIEPDIMDIEIYVGGASKIDGANRSIKLSANENPFGPSPKAIEAFRCPRARPVLWLVTASVLVG